MIHDLAHPHSLIAPPYRLLREPNWRDEYHFANVLRVLFGVDARDIATKGMSSQVKTSELTHGDSPVLEIPQEEILCLIWRLAEERNPCAAAHTWQVDKEDVVVLGELLHYLPEHGTRRAIPMYEDQFRLQSDIMVLRKTHLDGPQLTVRRYLYIISPDLMLR